MKTSSSSNPELARRERLCKLLHSCANKIGAIATEASDDTEAMRYRAYQTHLITLAHEQHREGHRTIGSDGPMILLNDPTGRRAAKGYFLMLLCLAGISQKELATKAKFTQRNLNNLWREQLGRKGLGDWTVRASAALAATLKDRGYNPKEFVNVLQLIFHPD